MSPTTKNLLSRGHSNSWEKIGPIKTGGIACVNEPAKLHFKISQVKKLVLTEKPKSVSVSGEQNYSFEINPNLSVINPRKKPTDINTDELRLGVKVNALKMQDVQALLVSHYNENWSEMENVKWYKEVINNVSVPDNPQAECEGMNEMSEEGQHDLEVNQVIL